MLTIISRFMGLQFPLSTLGIKLNLGDYLLTFVINIRGHSFPTLI